MLLKVASKAAALMFALVLAYRYYVWRTYYKLMWKAKLPVVPLEDKRWFMEPFGNFFKQIRNFHRTYDAKMDNFKALGMPLTCMAVPPIWSPEPIVNTIDPVVIRHILKDKFDIYVKPHSTIEILEDLIGEGIFAINHGPHAKDGGKNWALQRKTASKVFTNNNFKTLMFETFSEHSIKVAEVLNKKIGEKGEGVVDMQVLMFRYTLDSIGKIGFGINIDSIGKEDVPFAYAFDRVQQLIAYRFVTPGWNVKPFGYLYASEREIASHVRTLNEYAYGIIKQRKDEPTEGKGDILSLFLAEKLNLTDKDLRDVVMSFMIAGRDTTACTLTFALLMFAEHPEWQERLRDEVKAKLGNKHGDKERILTSNDISQMKLLQNVVMETLRLFPPVPVDIKAAAVDDILPGGHPIPAGTRVSFDPYILGRCEQFWGPDALEFNPDRWDKMANMPSAYDFPIFQAGPRICLGESLAKFEAALLLGLLVDKFKFSLPRPDAKYTYQPGITLTVKDGLQLKVERL